MSGSSTRSWLIGSLLSLLAIAFAACGGSETKAPVVGAEPAPRRLTGGHLASCLLRPDAAPECWGMVSTPKDLKGLPEPSAVAPRVLPDVERPTELAMGGAICVLEKGKARCGGFEKDEDGLQVVPLPADVRRIAVSVSHACALLVDRRVACWGSNSSGQLGSGDAGSEPRVVAGADDVNDVAVGVGFSCALRRDGGVLCWGDNQAAQLGDGTTTSRSKPAPVVDLAKVVAISAQKLHSCALLEGGNVRCWGLGDDGQLGDGVARPTDGLAAKPVEVAGIKDASAITVGGAHSCALVKGKVACWGGNSVGQVGDGTTTRRDAPVFVPGLDGVVEISAGGGHPCALLRDGTVMCWGNAVFGQTGDGTGKQSTVAPKRIPLR
ncbi:MAG: hypothetical protein HOV80_36800 [Polyangiaceae bacterium]|nr:hypothetical protein [Polyangiaceae bacterium]